MLAFTATMEPISVASRLQAKASLFLGRVSRNAPRKKFVSQTRCSLGSAEAILAHGYLIPVCSGEAHLLGVQPYSR